MRRVSRVSLAALLTATFTASLWGQEGAIAPPDFVELRKNFTVPEDLELDLVLAEPLVGQPLFVSFDPRGRMWVVQYLQYPFPAGIKILSEDKFYRATYDRLPPPPPNHFRGRDKITIHEDTDGDGKFDSHKTFVDGLNIVTSVALAHGGAWVLNPPYLLFYPDRDGDDVPDGDPEVHLEGFGIEDTHSNSNSLVLGPDGWLYGCMGSTVSGHVRRPGLDKEKEAVHSLGQLVWRYHPQRRKYEIFAEGGGNAFGLEIDAQGRAFSGHNGGDTRGFYYAQGAYLQKGFQKHGPLSNPFAFGYFAAMKHASVPRFTHDFLIYEGTSLPEQYRGKLFGVHPLGSHVVISQVDRDTSTFQTTDVGYAIQSTDVKFRPVSICDGPDGGIFVTDFYEDRIDHRTHHVGKINPDDGRIYRVRGKAWQPPPRFDLGRLSGEQLIAQLKHPDRWFRRTALRLLNDRNDASLLPLLRASLPGAEGQYALELLWAIHACGGFDEPTAMAAMGHKTPSVRMWAARLACDDADVAPEIAARLASLAREEVDVDVRSQLASSAKRLPAKESLAIVEGILTQDIDADDLYVPLLLWWAIESKCERDRECVLSMLEKREIWSGQVMSRHLVHRVMKRFAQAGKRQDLLTCARLLGISPGPESTKLLMQGFEEAFQGRSLSGLPDELAQALAKSGTTSPILALRQGSAEALADALKTIADEAADKERRGLLIQVLGEVRKPEAVPVLLDVLEKSTDDRLRTAALSSLSAFDDPRIAELAVSLFALWNDDLRAVALSLLSSRKGPTLALLEAVDAGRIEKAQVHHDVARRLTMHRDERIAALVAKHWGKIEGATSEEMQQQIARLGEVIAQEKGSPYDGKKLYTQNCGKCHRLFGEGGQIGPDLTSFKRDDLQHVLVNIVNPSAEIREGFETYVAVTGDGRTVTGFLVDRDNQVVILRGSDGQNVTLAQDDIEELVPQKKSLMPEGQLKELSPQQVRDLFAYLRSSQPLNE